MFYVPDDIYFAPYANMEKMAKFYNGFYPDFCFDTFRKLSEVFGLNTKARINGFSKGMQRQAEIVLGISTKPDFILFADVIVLQDSFLFSLCVSALTKLDQNLAVPV